MSRSLGLLLLKAGVVRPVDLIAAHRFAHPAPLADRLVLLGFTTDAVIAWSLVRELRLPRALPNALGMDPAATALLPRADAARLRVCPIAADHTTLQLAMADPIDAAAIAEVEARTGRRVVACVATPAEIGIAVERRYPREERAQGTT